jgi:hypothetical protein
VQKRNGANWKAGAACTRPGVNPDWFYPESMNDPGAWAARRICAACPVARECLADALETKDRFGIRGGLSPKQRSNLKKGRKPQQFRKQPTVRRSNARKSECNAGHPFTPENTRVYLGKRHCRTCIRDRQRAAYTAKTAKEWAA